MSFDLWEQITDGFMDFIFSTYDTLEPWFYPLIFVAIVGYIYLGMNSIIAGVAAILAVLAVYGGTTDIFNDVPDLELFFYIIVIIGVASLIIAFVIKHSRS